jgi:parallel beta-helix repeat protein
MSGIVLATLVPWLPLIAAKVREDVIKYGWLAIFQVLVILQLAHFGEHVSQMIELHLLDWMPSRAKGIIGELDIEPVHFWWNLIILFGATALLLRYRQNRWLWASFFFSVWHQIEHTYIYFVWYLPQNISGHPGIFGAGGLVDQANLYIPFLTTLGRADLHFWYNLFEIGLFVIAFITQVWMWQRIAPAPLAYRWLKRAALIAALVQVALIAIIALYLRTPPTLRVPGDYPNIQAAIDAAPEWAILRIGAGAFHESLHITKPLTLIGAGGDQTQLINADDTSAAVTIQRTHDVALKNFSIRGGLYGILVEDSSAVQLFNNRVQGASFVGIRLATASAEILGNEVRGARSPFGIGIELANTMSKPPSMIHQNVIADNPYEGFVMHNAHGMVENNLVTGNGFQGIAITEMSMAMVRGNIVRDNAEVGIYVVDNSMADIVGNHVSAMKPGPTGNADGIRAYYYAEVTLANNTIDCEPERAITSGYQAVITRQ